MVDLAKILTVDEMKTAAHRRVPKMFFEYADSGSYTESTYRANESDFSKIKLKQKVAVNLEGRNLKTTMLGKQITMPVAIAPQRPAACRWPTARSRPPGRPKNTASPSPSRP